MSFLSSIFRPIFELMAGLIALYFSWVHSYSFAIALLTITVMVVISPLTVISTRSMLQMQALQPKVKELQKKYGKDRQALLEAQQALFKEHKVSPASGCLPMLLQLPLLFVMYDVIRGLTNTVGPHHIASPKYIGHTTLLYKDLIASHGAMHSLGINLAVAATSFKGSFLGALPYYFMVLLAVGLQFLQTWQITAKNPTAAKANPQALMIQRFTPVIFGVIYIGIPSGVNLYFVVSGLFRVIQQEIMWRRDPVLRAHSQNAREKKKEAEGSTKQISSSLGNTNSKQGGKLVKSAEEKDSQWIDKSKTNTRSSQGQIRRRGAQRNDISGRGARQAGPRRESKRRG
jgi:YidC/Oxa1 family membrane protein insertase